MRKLDPCARELHPIADLQAKPGFAHLRGSDAGEASYSVMIKPGEEILYGNGRRFLVLDVVPFEEGDDSPFVGLLQVEAA